jgi:hypothetical protein
MELNNISNTNPSYLNLSSNPSNVYNYDAHSPLGEEELQLIKRNSTVNNSLNPANRNYYNHNQNLQIKTFSDDVSTRSVNLHNSPAQHAAQLYNNMEQKSNKREVSAAQSELTDFETQLQYEVSTHLGEYKDFDRQTTAGSGVDYTWQYNTQASAMDTNDSDTKKDLHEIKLNNKNNSLERNITGEEGSIFDQPINHHATLEVAPAPQPVISPPQTAQLAPIKPHQPQQQPQVEPISDNLSRQTSRPTVSNAVPFSPMPESPSDHPKCKFKIQIGSETRRIEASDWEDLKLQCAQAINLHSQIICIQYEDEESETINITNDADFKECLETFDRLNKIPKLFIYNKLLLPKLTPQQTGKKYKRNSVEIVENDERTAPTDKKLESNAATTINKTTSNELLPTAGKSLENIQAEGHKPFVTISSPASAALTQSQQFQVLLEQNLKALELTQQACALTIQAHSGGLNSTVNTPRTQPFSASTMLTAPAPHSAGISRTTSLKYNSAPVSPSYARARYSLDNENHNNSFAHVNCMMCTQPIAGDRYKCTVCENYFLCSTCEAGGTHPESHSLIKLKTHRRLSHQVPRSRKLSTKSMPLPRKASQSVAIQTAQHPSGYEYKYSLNSLPPANNNSLFIDTAPYNPPRRHQSLYSKYENKQNSPVLRVIEYSSPAGNSKDAVQTLEQKNNPNITMANNFTAPQGLQFNANAVDSWSTSWHNHLTYAGPPQLSIFDPRNEYEQVGKVIEGPLRAVDPEHKKLLLTQTQIGLKEFLSQIQSSESLHRFAYEHEVELFKRTNSELMPVKSFLGKGIVQIPARALASALRPISSRELVDELLKVVQVVAELDQNNSILYMQSEIKKMGLLKTTRDFSLLQTVQALGNDHFVIMYQSVPFSAIPLRPTIIRSELHPSGWLIQPHPNNSNWSIVTFLTQVDLKGNISNTLINVLAKKWPLSIHKMRSFVQSKTSS